MMSNHGEKKIGKPRNRIYLGDNLLVLRSMPSESVDLIYIDPPFNTGKTQTLTKIKTVRSESGDRKGFQGNTYKTIELGTKAYQDSFDDYVEGFLTSDLELAYDLIAPDASLNFLEDFLKPRLKEAYRILKPHGSLYFHIDYREVHYCKILLDQIFGRDCFINEIIWAYDFGGRSKSRWPAKHDNILFYVKDPSNYIFNTNEIDRIDYMAPGLVGPEKAKRKKLPTDTWWWSNFVGERITDTWWHSIIGTNSKERTGYPTQKPRNIVDRIVKASSFPGSIVLDFFAGSGTVGESCLNLGRKFILIDNHREALEVMARRFAEVTDIEWINFDPIPFQKISERRNGLEKEEGDIILRTRKPSKSFIELATAAKYIQKELEEQSDFWKNSPFEWVLQLPAAKKGKLARHLVSDWLANNGYSIENPKKSYASISVNGHLIAVKFSTLWTNGVYKFQQIRSRGYDSLICLGISPNEAHSWIFPREYAIEHATPQHKGAKDAEYWMAIDPENPPEWAKSNGGALDQAILVSKNFLMTE